MPPEIRFPHLGINISHLSETAFSLFGFSIKWYGVFIAIAVITGLLVAVNEAKKSGQNENLYYDYFIIAVIVGIIGARIYYVIFSWQEYKNDLLKIFALREGGLAIYGAVIAVVIWAVIFTKKKKYDFWLFVDTGIFGLIIGQVIGRWGNFFNREVFGGFTNSFFAMQYRLDTVHAEIREQIMDNLITYEGAQYIQVQPTFLYESLWNIGLFVILQIYKKHKAFTGEIFALYLFGYGLGRFWIEGIRTDQLMIAGVPASQALSLVFIILSAVFIAYKRISVKRKNS
ncbi:MAG: prolipoprotein diacylglyceryl transferase [Clostridiales bacterium]|jgi:phosphatidylglycerol:prolipoprotein diacylglycerol transferase|nr:prolipoprotein diacylglyceryl transferase [Clostridiales bacterium]